MVGAVREALTERRTEAYQSPGVVRRSAGPACRSPGRKLYCFSNSSALLIFKPGLSSAVRMALKV